MTNEPGLNESSSPATNTETDPTRVSGAVARMLEPERYEQLPNYEEFHFDHNGQSMVGAILHGETIDGRQPDTTVLMVRGISRDTENTDITPFNAWTGGFAEQLTKLGLNVLAINPPGMGGSEGDTFESSLNDRIAEHVDGIRALRDRDPDMKQLYIVGNSMGAAIAPGTAERLHEAMPDLAVPKIVLLSPSTFRDGAWDAHFGEPFRQAITGTTPEQMATSPGLADLRQYADRPDSHVLLMYVQEDNPPIPPVVRDTYSEIIESRLDSRRMAAFDRRELAHAFRKIGTKQIDNIPDTEAIEKVGTEVAEWLAK